MRHIKTALIFMVALTILSEIHAADTPALPDQSQAALRAFFADSVVEREAASDVHQFATLEDWQAQQTQDRAALHDMLGLNPLPEKTDLKATIIGTIERDDFIVEKLHFQSRPGLYVTANLYRPKVQMGKAPAVLYVCGHSRQEKDGRSFGNKTAYQHHGIWFARHGYVCLVIDTLQLGEIPGMHHGTYRFNRWWWNARGYSPAGVEAWNAIRAIDYLQSRAEVDPKRIGVTGRSGGGAYSWWLAALDERVTVAAPTAGITDLRNHVVAGDPGNLVHGAINGHCDCMFHVNTQRWDYPRVAALVAPRALMVLNTDKDAIFPLDGVIRVYEQLRHVYRLYGKADQLGIQLTEGPHKDVQELHIGAFTWMNRHLKQQRPAITVAAEKLFDPAELAVFEKDGLPADAINGRIDESFVARPDTPALPADDAAWQKMRAAWLNQLRQQCFAAWPNQVPDVETSALPLWTDDHQLFQFFKTNLKQDADALIMTIPAPVTDPALWPGKDQPAIQARRRFMQLGMTMDSAAVWEIRAHITRAQLDPATRDQSITLTGKHTAAGLALYAALFEPAVRELILIDPPAHHDDGPIFLNVRRVWDMPQAIAAAASHCKVRVLTARPEAFAWSKAVAEKLGWPADQLRIEPLN